MDIVVLSGAAAVASARDQAVSPPADHGPFLFAVASERGRVVGHVAASARCGLHVHEVAVTGDDAVAGRMLAALYPVARGGLVWAAPDPADARQAELLQRLGWVPAGADGGRCVLVGPRSCANLGR